MEVGYSKSSYLEVLENVAASIDRFLWLIPRFVNTEHEVVEVHIYDDRCCGSIELQFLFWNLRLPREFVASITLCASEKNVHSIPNHRVLPQSHASKVKAPSCFDGEALPGCM